MAKNTNRDWEIDQKLNRDWEIKIGLGNGKTLFYRLYRERELGKTVLAGLGNGKMTFVDKIDWEATPDAQIVAKYQKSVPSKSETTPENHLIVFRSFYVAYTYFHSKYSLNFG